MAKIEKVKAKQKAGPKKTAKASVKKAAVKARPKIKKLSLPKVKPALKKKEAPVVTKTTALPVKEKAVKKAIAPLKARPEIKEVPPAAAKVVPKEAPVVKIIPKEASPVIKPLLKELEIKFPIIVKDLAVKLQEKPSILIKSLMDLKVMAGINQALDASVAGRICEKYGYQIKEAPGEEEIALGMHSQMDSPENLKARAPVVTLMGHVDHGKTSLLDAIRKTKVAESEHGGITQHIGAYRVALPAGEITFLDTPGHEAFTAMRARGAKITDIVVLVVAADDGVMPQTKEAIDHSRAAGVSIIVAINKIDRASANIDRVKKQLSELGLTAEDWGGKTITVPVSAKTGQGIDNLLEMILLEAQVLELKANADRLGRGVVIETKLTKGRGAVATLLIQNGTLRLNDNIIVGNYYAKVRGMFNDRGQPIVEAGPSVPAEILGLSGVPQAGEPFFVIEDERKAKGLALMRQDKEKQQQIKSVKRISLEDLHSQIQEGKLKELKLIIKSDVDGSVEAIEETLNKLNISEIKLEIIHEGVGSINTSDVILAIASNALIVGFHVDAEERAKEMIEKEGVDFRVYNIIYELANDIKAALEGMLEPKLKKVFIGRAEVRKVFQVSRSGTIAGCFVTKGKILRSNSANLVRNGESVFEGKISSLKRFKDDVREVAEGFECGISLGEFQDIKEGDLIEAYDIEKIARKL